MASLFKMVKVRKAGPLLRVLKARNLQGVQMITSDAHKGWWHQLRNHLPMCHGNVVGYISCVIYLCKYPQKDSVAFREQIKALFKFTDIDIARKPKQR